MFLSCNDRSVNNIWSYLVLFLFLRVDVEALFFYVRFSRTVGCCTA